MRRDVLTAMVCLLVTSICPAQWLETTVAVPDSFSGVQSTSALAWNSRNNLMYVAGWYGVHVVGVDCATGVKRSRTLVPGGGVYDVCYDSVNNELYCAHKNADAVSVVDCSGSGTALVIPVSEYPYQLCCSQVSEKVYVAGHSSGLTAIDCRLHQVTAELPLGRVTVMCASGTQGRVYVGHESGVLTVIDCTADTVVAEVAGVGCPVGMVYNSANDRLYSLDGYQSLVVIDGFTNQVLARLPMSGGSAQPDPLCLNPVLNKLYCASYDTVAVVDCSVDTVITRFAAGSWLQGLCYNAAANKVYAFSGAHESGEVVIIDCVRDTVVARVPGVFSPMAMACSPVSNRTFAAGFSSDVLRVIDGAGDTLLPTVVVGTSPRRICWDGRYDKLYCASATRFEPDDSMQVISIDVRSNLVTSRFTLPGRQGFPAGLCANPVLDRLYVCTSTDRRLYVYDTGSDTLVSTIPLTAGPPRALLCSPAGNKVYVAADTAALSGLLVIDAAGDSVIRAVAVGDHITVLCHNPVANRLYVGGGESFSRLAVVDGTTDSVIRFLQFSGATPRSACWNAAANKLYLGCGSVVHVIDCLNDSVLATDTTGGHVISMCASPRDNKVFFITAPDICMGVIDGATNRQTGTIPLRGRPDLLLCDTIAGRVYCVDGYYETVTVVDCATNELLEVIDVGAGPCGLAWSPTMRRMYVANYGSSDVSVIRDTTPAGVGEGCWPIAYGLEPTATIVSSVLWLTPTSGRKPQAASLLDAAGRKVMDLQPGANDVRHLAAGVYFVHSRIDDRQSTTARVVVTR